MAHSSRKKFLVPLALILPLATCFFQWLFWDAFKPFVWFLFYPTAFFISRFSGKIAGIISTVISALLVYYFFIPPQLSFSGKPPANIFSVFVFILMGIVFTYTHDRFERVQQREIEAREAARVAGEQLREARINLLEAEQRLARQRLRESEELFRIMFRESSVAMAQADPATGRYLHVNAALCRFLGYPEDKLLKLTVGDVTHPDDRLLTSVQLNRLISGETSDFQMEKRFLQPDGSVVYGFVSVNLIRDLEGNPRRTMAVIQDITSRKKAEEELIQRNEELERYYRASVGRELEMIRLKQQVNGLMRQLGQEEPYDLSFADKPIPPAGNKS